jgi:hypothetical protein
MPTDAPTEIQSAASSGNSGSIVADVDTASGGNGSDPNAATVANANLTGMAGAPQSSTSGAPTFTAPQTDTSTISSSTLAPVTPIPFVTPQPSPIPSVSSLSTSYDPTTDTLSETPEEQEESALDTQEENLNNEEAGKAADTTAAQNAAGLPGLTEQQQDLSAQVTSLKNQAAAIPQQLQLDATGRGMTANGLAPLQSAALRNNSIQALSVSALLDATNGLIASANTKVTDAINAKYGPIEAQIAANTANLKLIANDPQTTIDDKNRAEAQLNEQKAQADEVAQQKQDATDVLNASITAAKSGADAATLQQMQQAPTGAAALAIAVAAGYGTSDVNDLATKYPDAGIQPGDSLSTAQQKVLQSPSYNLAQKSAMLDVETKEDTLANDSATSQGASDFVSSLPSMNGTSYFSSTDVAGMSAAQKNAYVTAAENSGAVQLSPKDSDALSSIQSAQTDLQNWSTFIQGAQSGQAGIKLPTNWLGQPVQYANANFNQYLSVNGQLAAYNSWTSTVIPILTALKGSGSGSGGASRLVGTTSNWLPSNTDTLPEALAKINIINSVLTSGASGILGYTQMTGPDGNTYNVPNGNVAAFTAAGGKPLNSDGASPSQ